MDAARARLKEIVHTQQPLALVGAGLSAGLGYPVWTTLLNQLDELFLEVRPGTPTMRDEPDQLWRAEEYKRAIPTERYHAFLQEKFGPRAPKTNDALESLVRAPFRHILTTNYDPCLDRAHQHVFGNSPRVIRWDEQLELRNLLYSLGNRVDVANRHYVHLHGRYDRPAQIVLSETDYTERYFRSSAASKKLFAMFATQSVVFVGFGFSDPDFMQLLREATLAVGSGDPRHFAILAQPRSGDAFMRRRLVEKFGIEPVFYRPTDDHSGLTELLGELAGSSPRAPEKAREDPDDPNKGCFGGSPEANHRRVSAKVVALEDAPSWYSVTITVESTDPEQHPLGGDVVFHLHPTFGERVRRRGVLGGRATLELTAWGAFTVGVETDAGGTRLELDLSMLADAPHKFRIT